MQWPTDHDRFAKLASGAQSFVICAGIIIGGGWTVYSFVSLRSVEKAELEARALRTRIPVLQAAIEVGVEKADLEILRHLTPIGRSAKVALFDVRVRNVGTGPVQVSASDISMIVRKVEKVGLNGETIYEGAWIFPLVAIGATGTPSRATFMPGAEQRLHYVFAIRESGLYVATFSVKASEESGGLVQTFGRGEDGFPISFPMWSTSVFFRSEK